MSFISYAQNLEDVMLYRALKHVDSGFYIDVGAQHPVIDSVTKVFYDRGWRGINVEPSSEYFLLLQQERTEDINLNVALGAHQGHVVYYRVPHTGMSTTRKIYADRYAREGYEVQKSSVHCTTLDAVCLEHGVSTVHFLNIDVEGAEKAVLEGFDFNRVRPWIVVIEANEPLSVRDVSQRWESILLQKGYEYVYYDGLNRFYLATEQVGLKVHFRVPPNLFDDYIIYKHLSAEQTLTNERTRWETLASQQQQEMAETTAALETTRAERHRRQQELAETTAVLETTRAERDRRQQELAETTAALETTRAEHDRRQQELAETTAALETTRAERDRQQQEINHLQQALSDERSQREYLVKRLQDVYASHSWRWTGPIRKTKLTLFSIATCLMRMSVRFRPVRRIGARLLAGRPEFKDKVRRFIRMDTPQPVDAVPPEKTVPVRRYVLLRFVFKFSLNLLNRFPWLKRLVRRAIARFPRFEKRLFQTRLDVTWADIMKRENLKTAPMIATTDNGNVTEARTYLVPMETGQAAAIKQYVYYWISDTIQCQTNTGVQRLTRCLAAALMELGTEIVFVCWDIQKKALIKATRSDLERLSSMNGPRFSPDFLAPYPSTAESLRLLHEQVRPDQLTDSWLVVPEVINRAFKGSTSTPDVIDYAKAHGMKTAFIFFDAIPLKLEDYADAATRQAEYMKYLAFADVIMPISRFAAGDLAGYLTHQFNFHPETLPIIEPILLPGEIYGTPRVIEYHNTGEELIILSVGTIEPRKNQVTLLEAFQHLCDRFPDAPLRLIFSGNLHPKVAPAFREAVRRNPRIEYVEYASDLKLAGLYRKCAFTVFPSLEEGFGLPIVESLWYGRPVICANFGSMAEIAQGGGCLTLDVHSVTEMENAMERMLFDNQFREGLAAEAISRPIYSWRDYAREIMIALQSFDEPVTKIKKLYYWVDHTCNYPANSGIQRVVRGLARALQATGIPVIPVKWNNASHSFYSPVAKELTYLAAWNGPDSVGFSRFAMSGDESGSWLLVPELITYGPELNEVVHEAKSRGLNTAIVFFDALPYKLAQFYSPIATGAHTEYMKKLMNFDCILPISNASSDDLQAFLFQHADRLVNIGKKLNPVILPGEFLEHPMLTAYEEPEISTIRILCVGTIEPRKNHLTLLESFDRITREESIDMELVLVGNADPSYPELEEKVNSYLERNHRIHWLSHVDDATLGKEYSQCHFTIYPSLDEGFGLPVLESLWYARPCICRNTGALAETAEGGGCLTVDTSNVEELARAMSLLATDKEMRARLGAEAVSRRLKTWDEYAREIIGHLARKTKIRALEPSVEPAPWPYQETKQQPLLSICITTYNNAKCLDLSLKTLMRWTEPYRDLIEVLVCDSTSKDDTGRVAEPFLKKQNFRYHRNPENVGMLGNLKATANLAQGKYVWILDDDDMVKEGAVEAIISAIREHPDISLIYLNYACNRIADVDKIFDVDEFLRNATPIVPPTPDQYAKIKDIATNSENFFTAIYCMVFRRDHALRAYSQNTSSRPFSTMLTCIPISYYVCNYMFEEMGLWVGQPAVVVNMNASWLKYETLWILESLPELYDFAEERGSDPDAVDRWRTHNFPRVLNYLNEICFNDTEDNLSYFSIDRLIQRCRHLSVFRENVENFISIYEKAYAAGKTAVSIPPEALILRYNLNNICKFST
jgi:FkbM family methyltransferase